jgi:membrane-associated phospholipid phosphatase
MLKTNLQKLSLVVFMGVCLAMPAHAQSGVNDSTIHPYHVNYWVSGPLLAAGITANFLGLSAIMEKKTISALELEALDREIINKFDRWALDMDPTLIEDNQVYSDAVLAGSVLLPIALLFDGQIRRDWLDILIMYLETMSLSPNIYEWSFMGPSFLNRIRPVSYYDELAFDVRSDGHNRNSFYSGHVASVAASTFFMVKVYSDYHPEIGNNKYLLYSAALVPPVILGYFRMKALRHFPSDILVGIGVGAICGVLVPELHRLAKENLSLGLYTTTEGTGLAVQWRP